MPAPTTQAERERRARLLATKLHALVRDHLGREPGGGLRPFPPGAALVDGDHAWVLLDEQPDRGLGPAMLWAAQQAGGPLDVVADAGTGVLARRAAEFSDPPRVWQVDGRTLVAVAAAPVPPMPAVTPEHAALRALIVAAGAEPVEEHGVLSGEVAGLEVCRVVTDLFTGAARVEVGIGAHDREAFALLHGDVPTADALADVVRQVAAQRVPGAPGHPLNRLAPERLLRERLLAEPGLVGAVTLRRVPPPVPRSNLKDATPCVAAGTAVDGRSLVVVCSVGVDLDLVPFAADARLAVDPDADLMLALARRDVVAPNAQLAGALRRPAVVVEIA